MNDLAHGFRRRQNDLDWLTGDTVRYDAATHRTRRFPTGHFDRDAVHRHEGETFVFSRRSFHRFRRDPSTGHYLSRVDFITRLGPVWGLSSAALSRIAARIASDERWEPAEAASVRRLFQWCRSLAEPIETPDILRLYGATPRLARQLLFVET